MLKTLSVTSKSSPPSQQRLGIETRLSRKGVWRTLMSNNVDHFDIHGRLTNVLKMLCWQRNCKLEWDRMREDRFVGQRKDAETRERGHSWRSQPTRCLWATSAGAWGCCPAGQGGQSRHHRPLFLGPEIKWNLACWVLDLLKICEPFFLSHPSLLGWECLCYACPIIVFWEHLTYFPGFPGLQEEMNFAPDGPYSEFHPYQIWMI